MSTLTYNAEHRYIFRPYVAGGTVSSLISLLVLANHTTTLIDYFTKETGTITAPIKSQQSGPKPLRHVFTEQWVSSPEHETAVLLDLRHTKLTKSQAVEALRQLYPQKEDTPGVRFLSGGTKMIIVFATNQLQQRALLYGFQMNNNTILYGTKALNGLYNHTLLNIEGLPMEDYVTTRTKLESSLDAVFRNTADPRLGQHRLETNPWPPTVHDVFFHPSNDGYYEGKVTVILRGSIHFLQQAIKLEAFNNETFKCKTNMISFYCHHCQRVDRHSPKYCPQVPRETS